MKKQIIGHDNKRELLNSILKGRGVHHGFLFSGPEHIGKKTAASSFARDVVCGADFCNWEQFDGIDSDIVFIEPERVEKKKKLVVRDISIDKITSATRSMALAPDKKARVLIINDAHRMTISAQNALLKTLEEPRNNRYVILITHDTDQLLQTIQSRCFHMQFSTVNTEILKEIYEDNEYLHDVDGRPGFLNRVYSDEEFRETVEYARAQLQSLSTKKAYERLALAAELAKKDDEYLQAFFQVWVYRIWAAAHKTKKYQLVKVADRVEQVLKKMRATNINKQLALEDLLISIV